MATAPPRNHLLYYCPEHAYHSRMHFLQRLAHALAARWDVTYVDADRVAWGRRAFQMRTPDPVAPVRHFSAVRLPGFRYQSVSDLSGYMEALQTRLYLRASRISPQVLWCFSTRALPILYALRDNAPAIVYWTGDEVRDEKEGALVELATHVFALSDMAFAEKRSMTNPAKVHLVPMAVDPEPYVVAAARNAVPTDLAAIPAPRIGYAGLLNNRIDWRLVTEAAGRRPRYNFVFVGPIGDAVAQAASATRLPNMHFLGHRDEPASFDYIAGMTVGIIPYVLSRFNLGSNPTKCYEYLAAGLPVVGTPLPALARLGHVVRTAPDPDGFALAIDHAVEERNSSESIIERCAVAQRHSYVNLVGQVTELLTGAGDALDLG